MSRRGKFSAKKFFLFWNLEVLPMTFIAICCLISCLVSRCVWPIGFDRFRTAGKIFGQLFFPVSDFARLHSFLPMCTQYALFMRYVSYHLPFWLNMFPPPPQILAAQLKLLPCSLIWREKLHASSFAALLSCKIFLILQITRVHSAALVVSQFLLPTSGSLKNPKVTMAQGDSHMSQLIHLVFSVLLARAF